MANLKDPSKLHIVSVHTQYAWSYSMCTLKLDVPDGEYFAVGGYKTEHPGFHSAPTKFKVVDGYIDPKTFEITMQELANLCARDCCFVEDFRLMGGNYIQVYIGT